MILRKGPLLWGWYRVKNSPSLQKKGDMTFRENILLHMTLRENLPPVKKFQNFPKKNEKNENHLNLFT